MRHALCASLNIRHNLSSSKGPKPLKLKLLTAYIPKASTFALAFSASQRLRTTGASARTFFTFRHYITPSARNFWRTFSSASVRTSVFPARTRRVNANSSAALTGRSTPLIMFSVNSAPSMMRQAV
ncbi:hypothetical protein [Shigella phage SGF3]|nr:hypothetical protein [Shigella phage SGF3]